jgi:Prokaryotic lipoprotein-attachment site
MMPIPTSSRRLRVLPVALLTLALVGLGACGRKGDITDLQPPPPPQAEQPAPGTGG